MTRLLRVLLVLVTITAVSPAVATPSSDDRAATVAGLPRPLGRIMFSSNRGGTFDLYTANEDGTDVRLVVDGPLDEIHPDVSPDGKRLVFVRAEDEARLFGTCCGPFVDLYTADSDGTGVAPLVPDAVIDDYRPDWAPDGRRIAFSRGVGSGGVANIFTIEPDGSGLQQVTSGVPGGNVASWSPDGEQLVFTSSRGGGVRLWVTDKDGGNPHPITDGLGVDTSPQWSPTGEHIVFGSIRDGRRTSELYTVRPDGRELTRITTNEVSDSYATWSPDGERIAVSRSSPGGGQLWVMNADGSNERRISDGPLDIFPVYFPHPPSPRAPVSTLR